MTQRSFALPLSGLALATTPGAVGCTPGIVGEWKLVEIELDGEDYTDALDGYSDTYTDSDGCTYTETYSVKFTLEIERDKGELEGQFVQTYSYVTTDSCDPSENESYSESYDYDADIESDGGGTWTIEIDDMDADLECTLASDELQCEGEFYDDDTVMIFERQ